MRAPIVGMAAILILLSAPAASGGGAAHTRPGGSGGGGGHAPGHVSGRGSAGHGGGPSGSARTRVSGHASYGYGHGSGGGSAGYGGYYPYYDPYWYGWGWGYGGWWGGPYYSMGVYWPPTGYTMGAQPETLSVDGSHRSAPAIVETGIEPKKATIRIDGVDYGRAKDFNGTWDHLTLAPGSHTFEFSAPGFMTLSNTVHLAPGSYARLEETLQKGEGQDPRSILVPAEAEPAPHTAVPEDRVAAGATLQRGLLKIAADPPDAAVYLDGEFLASARELDAMHGAIPVAVGEHEVEVTHPKMKSRSLRVEVSGGDPVHVDLRMAEAH